MKKERTCWLITDVPDSQVSLSPILADLGIRLVSLYSLMSTSSTVDALIENAASQADLVIAVLQRGGTAPNVYYELGYAAALRKRVLVFAPPGEPLLLDLGNFAVERVELEDQQAVRFAIERAIRAPRPRKDKPVELPASDRPIGSLADDILSQLAQINDPIRFEEIIAQAFVGTDGHRVAMAGGPGDSGYDFLVWSEAIQPYLGNPLPVEVKWRITASTDLDKVLRRLSEVGSRTQASWRVLVAGTLPERSAHVVRKYPNILVFSATDLLTKLRTRPLSRVLVEQRNQRVHGSF